MKILLFLFFTHNQALSKAPKPDSGWGGESQEGFCQPHVIALVLDGTLGVPNLLALYL